MHLRRAYQAHNLSVLHLQRIRRLRTDYANSPTITSSNSVSVAENAALVHVLTASETVTWSITGGADQALFEVSGSLLRFASDARKDFENPNDADTDNAYVVEVTATDIQGNATAQTITATITDLDHTPAAFTFTDVTGATVATVYTSNTVTISSIAEPVAVSITGGTYSVNGGSYTSSAGKIQNGDTVAVRVTSSGSAATAVNAALTVGGVSDTYTVTTAA